MPIRTRSISGWSRTNTTTASILSTPDVEVIARAVRQSDGRGVIARGLGRSYNESAQNRGGLTVDMTALGRVHSIDADHLVADVDAGVSLDALMRTILPLGLWLPVLPGTRQVTIGGAIAHDVHGKSHHSTGSFGDQVLGLQLLTADGRIRELTPDGDPQDPGGELFWATIGGMGLTGIVLRARLRLQPTETAYFLADGVVTGGLQETIDLHRDQWNADADYSAGWFDAVSGGGALGRGYFTRGRLATRDELPARRRRRPLAFDAPQLITVPDVFPNGLANRLTFGLMSTGYFRTGADFSGKILNISQFLHPLDFLGEWNRFYGSRGFLQYQLVLPPESLDALAPILRTVQRSGHVSFVNVLKMFGDGNRAPLSFPMPGVTATFDFAIRPDLHWLTTRLDGLLLDAGGRLYSAKDSVTSAETFHAMYPRIDEWLRMRRSVDPDGVFVSDMARRLDLV